MNAPKKPIEEMNAVGAGSKPPIEGFEVVEAVEVTPGGGAHVVEEASKARPEGRLANAGLVLG